MTRHILDTAKCSVYVDDVEKFYGDYRPYPGARLPAYCPSSQPWQPARPGQRNVRCALDWCYYACRVARAALQILIREARARAAAHSVCVLVGHKWLVCQAGLSIPSVRACVRCGQHEVEEVRDGSK